MNEENEQREDGPRYRSFFWPIVLIGVGLIWLLTNMGIVEAANLTILLRLWPVLLIVAGLDVLLGRRWPAVGVLIGIATVVAALILVSFAASLEVGRDKSPSFLGLPVIVGRDGRDVRTGRYREPIGNAASATVHLRLHSGTTTVEALNEGQDLIDADLTYVGAIDFTVSGDRDKTVSLRMVGADIGSWLMGGNNLPWDIRLTRQIPLSLNVEGGSGKAGLDLSQLQLKALEVRGGSGSMNLALPEKGGHYPVDVRGGSGSLSVAMPKNSDVALNIDGGSGSVVVTVADGSLLDAQISGGSGSVTIDLPDSMAAQVKVTQSGSGGVSLPSRLKRTDGGRDKTGTWETGDYAQAKSRATLTIRMGSGGVSVR